MQAQDTDILLSIGELVNYLKSDEQADYLESVRNGDIPEGDPEQYHIFTHVQKVEKWLTQRRTFE